MSTISKNTRTGDPSQKENFCQLAESAPNGLDRGMRIHVFQHYSAEDIGNIQAWADKRKHTITRTKFYEEGHVIPPETDYDFLVIMGGPQGANDPFPWMKAEKAAIRRAIDAGKYILGICLGSQLLADVLGGKVMTHEVREIGWFPIEWSDEALKHPLLHGFSKTQTVVQWHGDTFTLPPGVTPLARSSACENQGFIYKDRVVAIQFHLEITHDDMDRMVKEFFMELVPAPYVQSADKMLAPDAPIAEMESSMERLLDNLIQSGK